MSIQLSVKRVITATVRVRKYNEKKSSYYLLIPHEQMRGLELDSGDVLTLGLMGIEREGEEEIPEFRPTKKKSDQQN
jgi:hypothetical protein